MQLKMNQRQSNINQVSKYTSGEEIVRFDTATAEDGSDRKKKHDSSNSDFEESEEQVSFGLSNLKFQNHNESSSSEEVEAKINSNSAIYRALDLINQVEEKEEEELQDHLDTIDQQKNQLD